MTFGDLNWLGTIQNFTIRLVNQGLSFPIINDDWVLFKWTPPFKGLLISIVFEFIIIVIENTEVLLVRLLYAHSELYLSDNYVLKMLEWLTNS